MKQILVCVKAVPSSTSVEMDGAYRLMRDSANLQWNVSDESALEAALQLRDADTSVTVLTMGPKKLEGALKELLAKGADQAVLITDPTLAGADTHATAYALAKALDVIGPFDLILCGRRAMDGETGQVPSQLAAALGYPCITNAEKVEEENGALSIVRRLDDSLETLCVQGACVVTLCKYTYRLRPPSILSMRRAKSKTVELYSADDLGIEENRRGLKGSLTRVIKAENTFPGLRQGQKKTFAQDGVATLTKEILEVKG